MVTSMRMTSGRSSSARRTASAPSGASPTTSKPFSSIDRRSDSRSMRWSSASSRRTAWSVLLASGSVMGSRSWVLKPASDRGASSLSGFELQHRTDGVGPLAHAEHPVGVEAPGLPDREALAVVGDDQEGAAAVAPPLQADPGRPCMALDVADRLLGDAPHLPLLGDRQAGRLLMAERRLDARPLVHARQIALESVDQTTALGDVGAHVVERLPHLAHNRPDVGAQTLQVVVHELTF